MSQDVLLTYGGRWDAASQTLHLGHNAGFFSNCTVALWNLSELLAQSSTWPNRLDFSDSFSSYRSAADNEHQTDLHPVLFSQEVLPNSLPRSLPRINHHGFYRRLPFAQLRPVLETYFWPSAQAQAIEQRLIDRHRIDLAHTIAVVYRGTDKGIELSLASPEVYADLAADLLAQRPKHRILIQTDEASVRDMFMRRFGDRCFCLDEMPVSGNQLAVHNLDDSALRMDRTAFGLLLVAVTHLLSRADQLVDHTGNMGLWVCLWRGHAAGLHQFDLTGRLVDFSKPGFWLGHAEHQFRRVVRKLGSKLRRRPRTTVPDQ